MLNMVIYTYVLPHRIFDCVYVRINECLFFLCSTVT